ncbi:MAG TPA: MFS transporter [Candidatus Lumbricidophila sp.]|nr:MFS transporter [Candidatus Lumbricidophila sp.]
MGTYTELFRVRGLIRLVVAQLLARLPAGMMSLGLLLHIQAQTGSWTNAGLVLAAVCVGQAIAGPTTSRLMGRFGMRIVLGTTLVITAACVVAFAFVPPVMAVYLPLGALAGLTTPPISSAVRTIYPTLVNSRQLGGLFSLDASAQEVIWVVGPVLIIFVATTISTQLGVLMIGAVLLIGGTWFIGLPEVGRTRLPRSSRAIGKVLLKPPVALATAIGFLLVAGYAALEVAVVAVYGHGRSESGVLLAICAAGSLIGGFTFGHAPIGPWSSSRRMAIVVIGSAATLISTEFWWLAAALFVSGLGMAPVLAANSAIASASVKFSDAPEAFGWLNTGGLVGAALGSAAAGWAIDQVGTSGAFVIATVLAGLGAIVPAVWVKAHPDLRHGDVGPAADTAPVNLVG